MIGHSLYVFGSSLQFLRVCWSRLGFLCVFARFFLTGIRFLRVIFVFFCVYYLPHVCPTNCRIDPIRFLQMAFVAHKPAPSPDGPASVEQRLPYLVECTWVVHSELNRVYVHVSGAVSERRYCRNSTKKRGAGGVEADCQWCWGTQWTSSEVCPSCRHKDTDTHRDRQTETHTHTWTSTLTHVHSPHLILQPYKEQFCVLLLLLCLTRTFM